MPKLHYILAVICYLSIPVAVVCGVALFVLIDPEMARGHINYTRDYQWLERARVAVLGAAVSLACLLWVGCCYLVLKARQRSLRWLPLAAAGPLGFSVIAALEDRSPASSDRYQHVIRSLKTFRRVLLEIGIRGPRARTDDRSRIAHDRDAGLRNPCSADCIQWHVGRGRRTRATLPGATDLSTWPIVFNIAGWVFRHQPPQASSASIRLNSKS
jgi:hypothetical protein